ncbi:MAG: hypothetical protein CM15mP81_16710 [Alphaproteobacteria bacterium]|jgi:hypothetical protein|nr:MAG: hypothetical protein CM15mP81_16710 [Alphaproteobacteria bacterium]
MSKDQLLTAVIEFCKEYKMAESTFGRKAVNDGKFVSRLRTGARVTPETFEKVKKFINSSGNVKSIEIDNQNLHVLPKEDNVDDKNIFDEKSKSKKKNFRFFDNRQKYLLFVSTCSEKEVISKRIGMELGHIKPKPPAIRIFDAGMGDGTVLAGVMREMHHRYPTMPFYISGKEISLEDVRICLSKMSDRLFEHPASVLVFTNLFYSEAPWLKPKSMASSNSMVWKEVALQGGSSHEFAEQLNELRGFLDENWQAGHSPKTGNPIYERPTVLIIYREDHKFLLSDVIPKQDVKKADYDLVLASQPYRLRVSSEVKSRNVLLPLVRSLGRGGRIIGIHSSGDDPGHQILKEIWPNDNPFVSDRHSLLKAVKNELGSDARHYNIKANSDNRSIFKYTMHSLPSELEASIGTSTLFAAWNAATYVGQIDEQRLEAAMKSVDYLSITQKALKKYGGLWFNDESYTISRKND